jgi:hypothetical protein
MAGITFGQAHASRVCSISTRFCVIVTLRKNLSHAPIPCVPRRIEHSYLLATCKEILGTVWVYLLTSVFYLVQSNIAYYSLFYCVRPKDCYIFLSSACLHTPKGVSGNPYI